jgi:hypothetical protein
MPLSPYPLPWKQETWFKYSGSKEVDERIVEKGATNVETIGT